MSLCEHFKISPWANGPGVPQRAQTPLLFWQSFNHCTPVWHGLASPPTSERPLMLLNIHTVLHPHTHPLTHLHAFSQPELQNGPHALYTMTLPSSPEGPIYSSVNSTSLYGDSPCDVLFKVRMMAGPERKWERWKFVRTQTRGNSEEFWSLCSLRTGLAPTKHRFFLL